MACCEVFFYSLSIDPETDTPERLKQYADTFRAGPGWLFLTGKPEDIHAIRYKLGDRSRVLSEHRNEILLGNGATGAWARNNVLGDLDSLALGGVGEVILSPARGRGAVDPDNDQCRKREGHEGHHWRPQNALHAVSPSMPRGVLRHPSAHVTG